VLRGNGATVAGAGIGAGAAGTGVDWATLSGAEATASGGGGAGDFASHAASAAAAISDIISIERRCGRLDSDECLFMSWATVVSSPDATPRARRRP
jgi:hypothetical protein